MSHSKLQSGKKIYYLLPVVLLLLAGCVGKSNWTWQHPQGHGEQQMQQAVAVCEVIAAEEVNRYDYFFPHSSYYAPYYDRFHYRDSRYYYPSYYHYLNRREFQDRNRFFRICMRSKGWKKVKLNAPRQSAK